MTDLMRRLWAGFRTMTGDDAYERYLAHWRVQHAGSGGEPLDRAAFWREEQQRKWHGIKRCC